MRPSKLSIALFAIGILGGLNAHAAVKSTSTNCTHAVRQGTTQVSTASGCEPVPNTTPARYTGVGELANACEAAARARTTNPGNPIRTFTKKTGGGASLGTETTREQCELAVYNSLTAAGVEREAGGNVNTCQTHTKFSTAANAPICLSTTSFIFSYKANLSCAPIPGPNPKPRTCPAGQQGAWAQVGTRGPLPTCAEIWTPAVPNPGDCFTLDRTMTVSWIAPTRNTDGSTLTNLAGFRLSYGTNPNALVQTVQIANPSLTRYIFTDVAPATWFIAGKAYTTGGTESALSNTASKIVR